MSEYLNYLQTAIKAVHGCDASYLRTVPVKSMLGKQVAWEGEVEVFDISGHPTAQQCYAWGYEDSGELKVTAVLKVGVIDSPEKAVAASIAAL